MKKGSKGTDVSSKNRCIGPGMTTPSSTDAAKADAKGTPAEKGKSNDQATKTTFQPSVGGISKMEEPKALVRRLFTVYQLQGSSSFMRALMASSPHGASGRNRKMLRRFTTSTAPDVQFDFFVSGYSG